jgi:hypothetical protein
LTTHSLKEERRRSQLYWKHNVLAHSGKGGPPVEIAFDQQYRSTQATRPSSVSQRFLLARHARKRFAELA